MGLVFALCVVPPLGGIMGLHNLTCHLHLASHVSSCTIADGPHTGASNCTLLPGSCNPLTRPPARKLWTHVSVPLSHAHTHRLCPCQLSLFLVPSVSSHPHWHPSQAASHRPSRMRANPCLCLIPPQSIPHATPVTFLMRNALCYPLFRSISMASYGLHTKSTNLLQPGP